MCLCLALERICMTGCPTPRGTSLCVWCSGICNNKHLQGEQMDVDVLMFCLFLFFNINKQIEVVTAQFLSLAGGSF